MEQSEIYSELKKTKDFKGAFKYGLIPGLISGFFSSHLGKLYPFKFRNKIKDSEQIQKSENFQPIDYPKPDNKITFDILTSLSRSDTYHESDQPSHLKVKKDSSW